MTLSPPFPSATDLIPASSLQAPSLPPPPDKRASFGWPTFAIPTPGLGEVILRWPAIPSPVGLQNLRLTTAIDDRERKRVAVRNAAGETLGEFDLRFAHALETFSISLPNASEFLHLVMLEGTTPLWCLAPELAAEAPGLAPHFLPSVPPADPISALLRHLRSPDCINPWGWMEGCLLDGLERLAAMHPQDGYDVAVRIHLARFFTADGRLLAETSQSVPHDDAIDTIESTLMFAALAAVDPRHPWNDRVIAYWRKEAAGDGVVLDGKMLSAEGSYTIAFPMARLAHLRGDKDLASAAIRQLEARREQLWEGDDFWLRWYPETGKRTFRNWARGVTWHFLGSVRTAQEMDQTDPGLAPLLADLRRLASLVLKTQRPGGLWNCFLDDPTGVPDTSGSAGIATALALAARAGWIDAVGQSAALRCQEALLPFITLDGRLGGAAQSNRGGEALQRSDYRVLSAMGAGLAGQLHAALS